MSWHEVYCLRTYEARVVYNPATGALRILSTLLHVPTTDMSGPHSDTMSGFYKQLSQEQANEIHALKTQIAGFSAQITSLTAQVAAQKDQICLLEQDPGRSSGTASQDRQAVKLENERRIPAEDPGQPRPLAAALVSDSTICCSVSPRRSLKLTFTVLISRTTSRNCRI